MDSRSGVAAENTILSKAIRKKVKNSESIELQRYKIDNYDLLELDKLLDDVYCSVRPVSAHYDTRKDMVKFLNAMALDIYGDSKDSSPVLEAYGSFVMDNFSAQSDLDVSINFGNETSELPRDKKLEILKRFLKKLRSLQGQGQVRNVVSIFGARVPIVKFVDQGTAVECDLSVESKEGILNSQIIRIISQIDDRLQKLCLLIKHWAKVHEVNSAQQQTLNSVSITFLVAHHLQTQDPPILPPFSLLFKDGIDPLNVEKKTHKFMNWGQRNKESLGRLFVTFFVKVFSFLPFNSKTSIKKQAQQHAFFCYNLNSFSVLKLQSVEFLWRQGLCVSLLNGGWISKKGKNAGGGTISVEDFLDVSKNVARGVNGKGAIKIYSCINKTVKELFGFLNGKITGTHLRDSLFTQQAVVEPPPPPPEEHHNKRVYLEDGYRAIVGTGQWRDEERCKILRNRYAGNCYRFEEVSKIPRVGSRYKPLDDPYRQVPLNGPANGHLVQHRHDGRFDGEEPMHDGGIDLPPPPPPYGRVYRVYCKRFGPQNIPEPQ